MAIIPVGMTADQRSTLRTEASALPMAQELIPYLSSDLVGGSVPHIPGMEKETVWNAASQACATDRVHYAYTIADGRAWYLAMPSASLASHPDSWCPLAAALPGNSEFWDRETVYLYDQEGTAAGLRWDQETGRMQVFVGPSRTLLPRLQTLDANFVTISIERATPVPWQNQALQQEKLARMTVMGLFRTGLIVTVVALGFWLATHIIGMTMRPGLQAAQKETAAATEKLMLEASQVIRNDTDRHLFRIQELLDIMQNLNGTLTKYEVKSGHVIWEALIPAAAGGDNLGQLRAKAIGSSPDGRIKIQGTS